ncbi:oligosaccharide flippase family protein [Sphingomonas aracearum]|uniref:Uncharacterized protein n=1 Tax=Sphingomonas aracearum TaxID=2283317 RepID=A0A369VUT1_9SPHN|nr:oligosaccharide flippase family protein [Sphingomonas aracearum]RDE05317.1 hypothetical protein DVW87_08600 [Sphingomonas aracearum]
MRAGLRSAAAAFLAMGSRASSQFFLIAVTLVATRYLSPADFGVFAIATAFVTLARTLLYTGPFEYLMKAKDLDGCVVECLVGNALMATIAGLVLLLLAGASPWLFSSPDVAWLMLVLIPSNFVAAFASWEEALLLRKGSVRAYYVSTTLVELASSLAAIGLLVAGWKLAALVVQIYLRLVLLAIAYRLQVRPPSLHRPDMAVVGTVARWSNSRYGATFVSFLSNYSGDLILGAFLSPAATGLFRASNRVVTAASDMFSQPARLLAMTGLSHRFAQGKPADGDWFAMFVGIAFIGWPALIGVAMLGDWLAPVALGPRWAGAGPAIAILACARLWTILTAVTSSLLVAYDRQRRVLANQLATAIGVAALTVALSPWGVTGAAVASLVVTAATTLWLVADALRVGQVSKARWRRLLPTLGLPMVFTSIAVLGGRAVAPEIARSPPVQLAVAVACGALGWLMAVVLVRREALRSLRLLTHRG